MYSSRGLGDVYKRQYISCLAAIGLVQSKTAIIIDEQKIIATATEVQDAIMIEV
jgi:hypothetical protein